MLWRFRQRDVGRALNDIQKMHGEFEPPETDGDMTVITGDGAGIRYSEDYQMEVTTYTRGRGRLFCTLRRRLSSVCRSGYCDRRNWL